MFMDATNQTNIAARNTKRFRQSTVYGKTHGTVIKKADGTLTIGFLSELMISLKATISLS